MLKRSIIAWLVPLFALIFGASAFAQRASVTGTVSDETKAVLPGATVTATNVATGVQAVGVSDVRGEYRLLNLEPGSYKVQAELAGFSTVVVPSVELLVGQNATVRFVLTLAQVTETLTVTGEAPLVDVSSSQVAGNVDPRQMEGIPLQGRNWLELSKLVKGTTANEVDIRPGGVTDDMFQLNLDGQQVTQKISGGYGQPRFSRESIAEFQMVTNMFDITQGRSAGMQVQAISRSGTNRLQGSVYGFFRSDRFNAPDVITNKVLPYQNQQVGFTLGGPVIKDKLHYFASYEYEREPGTNYSAPAALPGQSFTIPYKNTQQSLLTRGDYQISTRDRLSVRGTYWDWANPFVMGANTHPSNATSQTKNATNVLGTWSRVISGTAVQELRVGWNKYAWWYGPQPEVGMTFEYRFPGLTVGKPYNLPQWLDQNYIQARYDLSLHRDRHDMKIGAEYINVKVHALWYLQREGIMRLTALPADIATRIPQSAPYDISKWDFSGLDSSAQVLEKNYNRGDWTLDVPGPTWALWFGDTWRVSSQLTLNYGVRWDVDWNVATTPDTVGNNIPIDNGVSAAATRIPDMKGITDYGYKKTMRDLGDVAPRVGFTWNVGGSNNLVIRGGSGLYFTLPQTMYTYSPQLYSRMITASFANDGKPGFLQDPTRGIQTYEQAQAVRPPQAARIMSVNYKNPYTWQSSIGFQKRLNDVTGIEVDLVHYNMYRDMRTIDPNLYYDPATGYNKNPSLGRPNKDWGQIAYFVMTGRSNYTALSSGLNRRLKNHLQSGVTYTVMLANHDDGGPGMSPTANNQFDYLDAEYATATAFQRHTVRAWAVYELPWGVSTSASYSYGSGNRFGATIATAPYGKVGSNRLNLTAAGGATSAITIPTAMLDRWNGPAVIASGAVIPRNALEGTAYHRVDLRLTKDIKLQGSAKVSLIGELYNVFNHANYLGFQTLLSATSAATTANFGKPSSASIPRQGQVAFRIGW